MFGPVMNIIKGAKGTIIYGILTKWYLLIAIPALAAAYYFFEGLQASGLLDRMFDFIEYHLGVVKAVAKYCTPLIGEGDVKGLLRCVLTTDKPLLEDTFAN
jgi:uncharacterized protein DUF2670